MSFAEARQATLSADDLTALRHLLQPQVFRRVVEAVVGEGEDPAGETPSPPLTEWLRAELARRHWTQKRLAEAVGVSGGRMSDWIAGKTQPAPESCERIADALDADADFVLRLAGYRRLRLHEDEDERLVMLVSMLRRIRLSDERYRLLRGNLQEMLATDVADRQRESAPPAPRPPGTPRQDRPVLRGPRRTPP